MIKRLFSPQTVTKHERKQFIPFLNQRNFMGELITTHKHPSRHKKDRKARDQEMIANLKKTTKQYLFDKKFKKMQEKVQKIERSMKAKEPNYDQEVNRCFQTLSASGFNFCQTEENYFIDFNSSVKERMKTAKDDLLTKIRIRKEMKDKGRNKKILKLQDQFDEREKIRETNPSFSVRQKTVGDEPKIKKNIFKQIGNNSEFMTDVTNSGIKYQGMVEAKKINPWKKWYTKEEIQLFPGSKVIITKLQKSIY